MGKKSSQTIAKSKQIAFDKQQMNWSLEKLHL